MLLSLTEKIVDGVFATIPRAKPRVELIQRALLIAHRGAHDNKKGIFENTLKAFKRAKEMGCWGIEFDLHSTCDGVYVVNHDPNLTRLWGVNAKISALTFKQLRKQVPNIPSLQEVVAAFGQTLHLFIELKVPIGNPQHLFETLQPCLPIRNYHLLSLNPEYFPPLNLWPKESLLLVAGHNNVAAFCDLSVEESYGGVLGNYALITNKHLRKLRRAKQTSGVGFVNSKNSLYRELNRELNWLFTNKADRLSQYLQDLLN